MSFDRILLCALFSVLLASCSTKKDQSRTTQYTQSEYSLELNGSSDNQKAGMLRTIYFEYNSSSLDNAGRSFLQKNAEYLKSRQSIEIQIEGHCDERGSRQFNLALGERRAKAIRDYLIALGIKSHRMKTLSWGNERPMLEGSDESSWSKNRRTSFVIISL